MARILFIYPPISKKERYSSDIGNSGGRQIPLGIYYLAGYMLSKGYEVQVIDAEAENLTAEEIVQRVGVFKPNFIGIGSTTVAFHRALEVAHEIKAKFSLPIILGGPHITSNYQHAMSYPVFDYGVYGEGEITMHELCEALLSNAALHNIQGVIYREEGQPVKNEPRPFIEDLDTLPFPAYELIPDINKYTPAPSAYKTLPVRSLITSRGCPGQCTFCDKNIFGSKYRRRSAKNIFDEIILLRDQYGVKEIDFVDDTFLVDKKRVYELFALLDEANIKLDWSCRARIRDLHDDEFVAFIKKNGCWKILLGIESGDDQILKEIRKNTTVEAIRHSVLACRKHKIKTAGFFIIGHPSETTETIEKTIKFALSLPLDDVVATINTPIPGSVQYRNAKNYGTLDETDWSQFNYWRPVFVPHGLTKEILLQKHKELYRRFYMRPCILMRYALSLFGKGGIKRIITLIKSALFLVKT
ncbi:MAG: B12-binding domain-containing radical SAM protein [Defluviitaleaceae bacterium]|nr:B12-binding domain-containing radical SAM protein [Defluviitaleaceae bacterium]MCL2273783.1 B12-binding domain-containing radical SAM protein [Defluviitaleaceae bacterium]